MTVGDMLRWLDELAPFESAEDFDNVGLLAGDERAQVAGVMFGLDLTMALVDAARDMGANLIVTHHPFIFQPIRRIDYSAPQGELLCALTAGRVNVVAMHTNWDKASGGVGDALARSLGLLHVERADDYVRVGDMPAPMTAPQLGQAVREALRVEARQYGVAPQSIARVAVGGGAYGEGYAVAIKAGAQAYLTGEIHHHEALDACERGLWVLDGGHYATEAPGIAALYQRYLTDAHKRGLTAPARLFDTAPYAGATLAL